MEHQAFYCVTCFSSVYCASLPCSLQSGTQDDEAASGTIEGDGKQTLNYALHLKYFCFHILLAGALYMAKLVITRVEKYNPSPGRDSKCFEK